MSEVDTEKQVPLKELVKQYFSRRYLYKELSEPISGFSGIKWRFDAVISTDNKKFGVFIRDWNRSVGVNQVRRLEKACIDVGFDGGLLIGRIFSGHARQYGKIRGVQLLTKSELERKLEYG